MSDTPSDNSNDIQAIKGARINKDLGNNELRDYLAGKEETGSGCHVLSKIQELVSVRTPMDRPARVLLLAPRITIPKGMVKRVIPPLGLSYIAASLEKENIPVEVIDCTIEGYHQEEYRGNLMTYGLHPDKLRERILAFKPDIVGVSVLFSTDLFNMFETCRVIRKLVPDVTMVVGGLHATIYPREIFSLDRETNGGEPCVDYVIRGEGEYRLIDFIRNLEKGVIDRKADGFAGYLNRDKFDLFVNNQVSTIEDLDALPFPAYHLLPMEKYFEINVPFAPAPWGDRISQLLTTRGCPIGCSFCASTNMYKKHRARSVPNIIAEIEDLKARYQIDEIQFADDNLTLLKERTEQFMPELAKCGVKWCTANGTMINTLSPELLESMARAGLYQITLSLDSGSAKTLKNLHHKPCDLTRIPGLIAKAQEFGVFTHGTLVVGMPGESLEDIREGFDFVLNSLEFTSISTFIASAIPGSELFHNAIEKGLISRRDAFAIDTTKSNIRLSHIEPVILEKMVMDFQSEFTTKAMERDKDTYQRKYGKLIKAGRMPSIFSNGGRLT